MAHLSELGVGIGKSGLFDIDEVIRGLKGDIIGIQAIGLIDFQQETRITDIVTVTAILYLFSNVVKTVMLAVDKNCCETTGVCPSHCRAVTEGKSKVVSHQCFIGVLGKEESFFIFKRAKRVLCGLKLHLVGLFGMNEPR